MGLLGLLGDMLADRKVRRLLATAPAATLDALPENTFACVTGEVDMLHTRALEAPLSGRLCAYYSIVILARYRGTAEELGSEQEGIPFSLQVSARATGTDADAIHFSRGGVPTGLVSIPLRYMHSPVEMVQLDDVEDAARLIAAFARRLSGDLDLQR